MKSFSSITLVVFLVTAVATVQGYTNYRDEIPNGYNVMSNGVLVGGVGHVSTAGSGARNTFGAAYATARTWSASLCAADSDGDGQTNGFELGDPDCVWTKGDTPSRTSDISHPGVASSTSAATPAPTSEPTTLAPGETVSPTNATTTEPPTPTTTTVTIDDTPQPETLVATTSLDAGLGGFLSVSWTIFSNSSSSARRAGSTGDVMDLTMTFTTTSSEQWAGIGFASTGMDGPLVIGYVDSTGAGNVVDWVGSGSVANFRTGSTTLVSASIDTTTGTRTLVARISLEEVGVTASSLRTIFSKGTWNGDAGNGGPSQHDTTSKKTINFYTGESSDLKNDKAATFLGFILAIVVTILVTAIGGVLNFAGVVFSPTASKILWALTYLIFILLLSFVTLMAHGDYVNAGQSVPFGRALGDAATFCFFLLLWPTMKHIGPAKVIGISYERFLVPHQILGCLVLILMTAHFGVMFDSAAGGQDKVFTWGESNGLDKRPNVAGFIAWVLLVCMAIPAIFLRRVAFTFFRTMHMLFLFVIIFGAIHHWPLWIFIAPGFLAWFIDVIIRVVAMSKNGATFADAEYHQEAGVTELTVNVSKDFILLPGQYAFVTVDPLGGWAHPFSVASVDRSKNTVSFFIKNMGKGTFTEKLALAAEKKELGPGVMMVGPYGLPSVPLTKPNHLVLCSGGIGVTPMLSTLQYIGERCGAGELSQLKSVKFIWTIQNRSVFDVILPDLNNAVQSVLAAGVMVEVAICVTRGEFNASSGWYTVVPGRPTYSKYIAKAEGEITAVYSCGPPSMMSDVATAAGAADALLHAEAFEF